MTDKSSGGTLGSFVFAVGATIILFLSLASVWEVLHSNQYPIIPPIIILGFIGFFLVGLGLWLIQTKT